MASPKDISGPAGNTVIGPSILISGKLSGDEDLTVRGRVEGELALTRTLIVEPSGVVKANVSVKNAVVSGVVVGNIAATESVELTRDGRMVGDIRSPRAAHSVSAPGLKSGRRSARRWRRLGRLPFRHVHRAARPCPALPHVLPKGPRRLRPPRPSPPPWRPERKRKSS
jgi:hypothetical protein